MAAEANNVKVALVRAPPPNWPMPLENQDWTEITIDISQSVQRGIELIQEAKANGATLVAFPELWFPGFPKWRESNDWKTTHLNAYIDNALVMGSEQWDRLIGAIASAQIWTALAFAERDGDHIYMSQALISPAGTIVHHRRKLRPSGSERDIFSDGKVEDIKVVETELGRVGMLQCGEHWFPSTTILSAAQRPRLHIGCYPFAHDFENTSDSQWYNGNTIVRASSSYALLSGAHVLMPSVGYTFVLDPMMRTVAEVRADTDYAACPILYHEIPAKELLDNGPHVMAAQTGRDVVEQVWKGYPDSAPETAGELVPAREVSVDDLKSGKLVWSEIGPGTAAMSPVPITV